MTILKMTCPKGKKEKEREEKKENNNLNNNSSSNKQLLKEWLKKAKKVNSNNLVLEYQLNRWMIISKNPS